uniref:Uncharacterized protein n=1 Tax=Aegilops tauschii subsp. strangulata TaxID=200361 RepID=A0A453G5V2_AEGTS
MSWRTVGVSGLPSLLAGTSGPFATGDWILPDLTIQNAARMNADVRTFPDTFYFSYATRRTTKFCGITVPSGVMHIHPLVFIHVMQLCRWRHFAAEPPCKGYRDEDWEDNDGALNTISMTHPRIPVEHPSIFVEDDSDCHQLQPGIWQARLGMWNDKYFLVTTLFYFLQKAFFLLLKTLFYFLQKQWRI